MKYCLACLQRCPLIALLLLVSLLAGCATGPTTNISSFSEKLNFEEPKYQPVPVAPVQITPVPDIVQSIDLWERIRTGFDISDPEMEIINRHTKQLVDNPTYVKRVLERSSPYLFYIIEEVEAREMPSELALLPFVESAFNPKAVSPAKAAGMWQFMPATGKYFNLKQNMFRDERSDIIKSTRAALDYLQKLYDQFGDWQLALAAYNWGEGSVSRAINKNKAAKLETDYFSLKMPNETKNYVPKLLAYKRIIENPAKYGFTLPKVENHPYFVTLPVTQDIDVDRVITLSEMTREQFLDLNPSFNKPVIMKGFNQEILLPYGKAEIFRDNILTNRMPLTSWTAIKVEKTDSLEKIVANLGLDIHQVREMNSIPKGMKVRKGSSLLVPKMSHNLGDIDYEIAQNGILSLEREYVPVPVVMKCQGKKCVAVPKNLANYQPKHGGNPKAQQLATSKSSATVKKSSNASTGSNKSSVKASPNPNTNSPAKKEVTKTQTAKAGNVEVITKSAKLAEKNN